MGAVTSVSITLSPTINVGNFQSLKAGVTLHIAVDDGESVAAVVKKGLPQLKSLWTRVAMTELRVLEGFSEAVDVSESKDVVKQMMVKKEAQNGA